MPKLRNANEMRQKIQKAFLYRFLRYVIKLSINNFKNVIKNVTLNLQFNMLLKDSATYWNKIKTKTIVLLKKIYFF